MSLEKLNKFIGKELSPDVVGKILSNLGLGIRTLSQDTLVVIPPTYRGDLTRTADIYEEIIRMYGFENIEPVMPIENIQAGKKAENIDLIDNTKEILREIGLQEVINYSFIPKNVVDILNIKERVIEIKIH